jgi:glycosyltransferase involved in cell wall biosynthesis
MQENLESPKKVMLVGMANSIHVARWIRLVANTDTEMYLFPSTLSQKPHSLIQDMVASRKIRLEAHKMNGLVWRIIWITDLLLGNWIRGKLLERAIRKYQPDLVHILEFQHAGYLALQASSALDGKEVLVTNYGSDIYWFSRFPRHERRIRALLGLATAYSAECQRDVLLAEHFGFRGRTLPVIPNSGGFDEHQLYADEIPLDQRDLILVKGYNGWSGQARLAVMALSGLSPAIKQFSIIFYSCNLSTILRVRLFLVRKGLRVQCFKKGVLSHSQMLELMAKARIYLGVSRTDGISTSLLESIARGAFPIQSVTSCANEWVEHRKSGYLLQDNTVDGVKSALTWSLNYTNNLSQQEWQGYRVAKKASLEQVALRKIALKFY